MARITVEDCLPVVQNRFELVMVSSKRAHQLATGGKEAQVEWENDKPTVVALREIELGLVNASILEEKEDEMDIELELEGHLNEGFGDIQSEMGEVVVNQEGEEGMQLGSTPDADSDALADAANTPVSGEEGA